MPAHQQEADFEIWYNGDDEELKRHRMKAASVAKSIRAVETIYLESFKEANRVFRTRFQAEVMVQGGFGEGSLKWIMRVLGREEESFKPVALDEKDESLILTRITASIRKVVELIKSKSKYDAVIEINESADGLFVTVDGKMVEVDFLEAAILTNEKIRSALSDLAYPLYSRGINQVSVRSHGTEMPPLIDVDKSSLENVSIKRTHEFVVDQGGFSGFYYIDTLSYSFNSKWKLVSKDDPGQAISVDIVDTEFVRDVLESTEKFSKDDLIEVEGNWIKSKTSLTGRVKTKYTVTKVLNHIEFKDRQIKL